MQNIAQLNPFKSLTKVQYLIVLLSVGLVVGLGGLLIYRTSSSNNASSQLIGSLDTSIARTQQRLSDNPKNVTLLVSLCQAYLQKVRETADPSYYTKCDPLLKTAKTQEPNNAEIIGAEASVAYGRHNFEKGLALAQTAVSLNPNRAVYYGLAGDGQIELGQYDSAVASYQTMVSKRPDLSSYNRVAYIREIYGDISGAKSALTSAIASGSAFPENIAYSQVELSKLYARTDLDQATKLGNQALQTYKNYPPAFEILGKIAFARRDYAKAVSYFEQAFNALPLAQYAYAQADTYTIQGNRAKAAQQYYLADIAFDKSISGGVNNDFEKAIYLTDHGRDLPAANELAIKAATNRPNIFTIDGLAWNLYKQGKYAEAQATIQPVLSMGESVPIILYHAGMIAAKLEQADQAKSYLQQAFVLDKYFLETHFSLLDYQAGKQTLQSLTK